MTAKRKAQENQLPFEKNPHGFLDGKKAKAINNKKKPITLELNHTKLNLEKLIKITPTTKRLDKISEPRSIIGSLSPRIPVFLNKI